MANYILNTTNVAAWNVDAWNLQAVMTTDQPNGRLVTLASIDKDSTTGALKSYRYNVTLAGAKETNPLYIIDTPEVDVYASNYFNVNGNPDDILNWTNPKGKSMSIRKLNEGDVIEIGNSTDYFSAVVTASNVGTNVNTAANGKFEVASDGTAFVVEALNSIRVGGVNVPTVLLRKL